MGRSKRQVLGYPALVFLTCLAGSLLSMCMVLYSGPCLYNSGLLRVQPTPSESGSLAASHLRADGQPLLASNGSSPEASFSSTSTTRTRSSTSSSTTRTSTTRTLTSRPLPTRKPPPPPAAQIVQRHHFDDLTPVDLGFQMGHIRGRVPREGCQFPPVHQKDLRIFSETGAKAKIAVVMSIWGGSRTTYSKNIKTWDCYCMKHHCVFRVIEVDIEFAAKCPKFRSNTFQRHCAIASIIDDLQNPKCANSPFGAAGSDVEWIFAVDGDTFVYSFEHRLDGYLPKGNQSLLLYERWAQGEPMAGTLAVKVSDYGSTFLRRWSDSCPANQPRRGDNPVLISVLLDSLVHELLHPELIQKCQRHIREAQYLQSLVLLNVDWIPILDRATACYRFALGPKRVFRDVVIQRRGHSFASDEEFTLPGDKGMKVAFSDRTFVVHGAAAGKSARAFDQAFSQCPLDAERCIEPRLCQLSNSFGGNMRADSSYELMQWRTWSKCERLGVPQNDVGHCIADHTCTEDLTEEEWASLGPQLQENAECANPTWTCQCSIGLQKLQKKYGPEREQEEAKFKVRDGLLARLPS